MEREQIVDAVRDWLDNDDWRYEYNAEDQILHMGVGLKSKIKSGKFLIIFGDSSYTVYLIAPLNGDPENISELGKFMTMANYGLRNGNFELDLNDGEIRYKVYVNCEGLDELPEPIIRDSIYVGCFMMDRYGDGIAALSLGFSDADTEIKKAEAPEEDTDSSAE
jgi:hypothetical protein